MEHIKKSDIDIVFIHGAGGNQDHWPVHVHRLPGIKAHTLALPGHGNTPGPGFDRIEDYASWVKRWVEERGLTGVVLAGHSMGSAICMKIALDSPLWLEKLILVGAGARLRVLPDFLEGLKNDFEGTLRMGYRLAFGPNTSSELVNRSLNSLLQTPFEVVYGDYMACDRFDIMDVVCTINYPTLIIGSDHDIMTPLKYSEFLNQQIPNSILKIIKGAGHMMALEFPEIFSRFVDRFVKTGH